MMDFNKRKHEEELKNKIQELTKYCMFNGIPLFVTACIDDNGKKSEYISEMVSPDVLDVNLSDNRFPKYVNIGLGFDTVPANEIIEIEM